MTLSHELGCCFSLLSLLSLLSVLSLLLLLQLSETKAAQLIYACSEACDTYFYAKSKPEVASIDLFTCPGVASCDTVDYFIPFTVDLFMYRS